MNVEDTTLAQLQDHVPPWQMSRSSIRLKTGQRDVSDGRGLLSCFPRFQTKCCRLSRFGSRSFALPFWGIYSFQVLMLASLFFVISLFREGAAWAIEPDGQCGSRSPCRPPRSFQKRRYATSRNPLNGAAILAVRRLNPLCSDQ